MLLRRLIAIFVLAALTLGGATACSQDSDANVVNENLAKDADNFKILRRTVFINGITDNVLLLVEGYCSIETDNPNRWAVTCKTGNTYIRNFMGKSDNVTMVSEQVVGANVSPDHYRRVYKPTTLIPAIEIR